MEPVRSSMLRERSGTRLRNFGRGSGQSRWLSGHTGKERSGGGSGMADIMTRPPLAHSAMKSGPRTCSAARLSYQVSDRRGIGNGDLSAPLPPALWNDPRPTSQPLGMGNLPLLSSPPVGIGNREWGIGEEDLPTPHPTAFFSPPPPPLHHSPFPRFPIPDCRFPITSGRSLALSRSQPPLPRSPSRPAPESPGSCASVPGPLRCVGQRCTWRGRHS